MESKKATSVLSDIMQKLSSIGKPEEVKEEVVELSEEVTEEEVKEEEVVLAEEDEVAEEIVEEEVEEEEIVEEELDEEKYVSREEFENAIADIKAMFIEVSNGYEKEKLEMSAQIEDLSKAPASEPLSHSPEAELSTEKKVLFSQKRKGSTMDRVLSKMNRK
jgi:F420-dependent methylenetetrahydromethanopterin dehydrogenase